ncbi:MAG: hypothetical protein MUC43_03190 [Pirellula sp.]|jgi:hypothetical protein|nr:hypothetical protein [Pirellula sp.]
MKKQFLAALAISTVFYVGCGGGDKPVADAPPQVPSNTNTQMVSSGTAAPSAVNAAVVIPTEPKEIVRVFLEAMRKGDGQQLSVLFTNAARKEIERQGLPIDPTGSAQATFTIDEVTEQGEEILVSTTWLEPEAEGQPPQKMEVVWILYKDVPGWRIAGMAVATGPTENDLEIVNFENLDEPTMEQPAPPQERVANLPNGQTAGGLPGGAVQPGPASAGGLPTGGAFGASPQLPPLPGAGSPTSGGLPPVGGLPAAGGLPPANLPK